jgi:anti-sigma B factor antagonist
MTASRQEPFEAHVELVGSAPVMRLAGELDIAVVDELEAAVAEARSMGSGDVVIDLRGLTFLDSRGIAALVAADLEGRDGQRPVKFIRGPRVHRVFELTGVAGRVEWVESV